MIDSILRKAVLPVAIFFSLPAFAVAVDDGGSTRTQPVADSAVCAVDSVKPDTRPFLKRIFKDFPTVYSDTAYSDTDYVVVFRCTLMNHSWHRHSGEVKKGNRRKYSVDNDRTDSVNMVKFKSAENK